MSPAVVDHLNALADALAAGPLPSVLDNDGNPLQLGRDQVGALRRAEARKLRRARIWLSGGRELTIDAKTGSYALKKRHSETDGGR
jgi:hypothetical protein